jgi:hypothetical protein
MWNISLKLVYLPLIYFLDMYLCYLIAYIERKLLTFNKYLELHLTVCVMYFRQKQVV